MGIWINKSIRKELSIDNDNVNMETVEISKCIETISIFDDIDRIISIVRRYFDENNDNNLLTMWLIESSFLHSNLLLASVWKCSIFSRNICDNGFFFCYCGHCSSTFNRTPPYLLQKEWSFLSWWQDFIW